MYVHMHTRKRPTYMKRNMWVYYESAVGIDAVVIVPESQVCLHCTCIYMYTQMCIHMHVKKRSVCMQRYMWVYLESVVVKGRCVCITHEYTFTRKYVYILRYQNELYI